MSLGRVAGRALSWARSLQIFAYVVARGRTEAHHWHPWAGGGKTDLADGVLLCSHHHHRAHDTTHRAQRLPNGDVRFHRRR